MGTFTPVVKRLSGTLVQKQLRGLSRRAGGEGNRRLTHGLRHLRKLPAPLTKTRKRRFDSVKKLTNSPKETLRNKRKLPGGGFSYRAGAPSRQISLHLQLQLSSCPPINITLMRNRIHLICRSTYSHVPLECTGREKIQSTLYLKTLNLFESSKRHHAGIRSAL